MTDTTRRASDWSFQTQGSRIERLEAYFSGHAYQPHRHDTYAIGITLAGVQCFRYRGALRRSTAGHAIVLHPDEVHDGHAGTTAGFHYRMLYVPPSVIQDILGGRPLPFVAGGVTSDRALITATWRLLNDSTEVREPFAEDDALFDLSNALLHQTARRFLRRTPDYPAARRARDYLDAALGERVALADLEQVCGHSRWRICRDFRFFYGTSPYRYLTLRRLDSAKKRLMTGQPVAETAHTCGFADQSHLTRQFTQAFGMPPARWVALAHAIKTGHQ